MKVHTLANTKQFLPCIQLQLTWSLVNKHEPKDTENRAFHTHQFMKHTGATHYCQQRSSASLHPELVII